MISFDLITIVPIIDLYKHLIIHIDSMVDSHETWKHLSYFIKCPAIQTYFKGYAQLIRRMIYNKCGQIICKNFPCALNEERNMRYLTIR